MSRPSLRNGRGGKPRHHYLFHAFLAPQPLPPAAIGSRLAQVAAVFGIPLFGLVFGAVGSHLYGTALGMASMCGGYIAFMLLAASPTLGRAVVYA